MPFTVIDAALAQAAPVTTLGNPNTSVGITLEELRNELDALLIGRSDIDSSRFDDWINEAYLDIYTSIDWPSYSLALTLVVDQPMYLLPEVVEAVEAVSMVLPASENLNEGYPLDPISKQYYRSLVAAEGDPKLYFRQQNILVLYPTPDAVRTIALDVSIRPQPLTAATHSPILPREFHEALKLAARKRAHSAIHEFDKSARVQNEEIDNIRKRKDPESLNDVGRVFGSSAPHRRGGIRNVTRSFQEYDNDL